MPLGKVPWGNLVVFHGSSIFPGRTGHRLNPHTQIPVLGSLQLQLILDKLLRAKSPPPALLYNDTKTDQLNHRRHSQRLKHLN